ncbi:UNKNOWN [Stylonychia lemnae]|uniref:Uncharacterized protein n=1 Tax=Stylonychia lemnae TaxID=5949 RepID=A0A077ZSK9_STYLE|nr:UNKNOWN [Stylonychia lemnae]|eukprot:CDW71466.1 UNKNOWN [Stylonychia lemnae]
MKDQTWREKLIREKNTRRSFMILDHRKFRQQNHYHREIKDELFKIEQLRQKNEIRNDQMLQKVQETLNQTFENQNIQKSRYQLEEAKKTFLRELNKRDPSWREKLRARKLEEIKRMELAKDRLGRDLAERQRQLEEETYLNDQLRRMRDEYDEKQYEVADIERKRRALVIQEEIGKKQRELEQVERQLDEEKRQEQQMINNEQRYKDVDKQVMQENTNPNKYAPVAKPPIVNQQQFDNQRQKQGSFGVTQTQQQIHDQKKNQQKHQQSQEELKHNQNQRRENDNSISQQQNQQKFDFNMANEKDESKEEDSHDQDKSFNKMASMSYNQKTQDNRQNSNKNILSPSKSIQDEQVDEDYDDFLNRKASEVDNNSSKQQKHSQNPAGQRNSTQGSKQSKKQIDPFIKPTEIIQHQEGRLDFEDEEEIDEDEDQEYDEEDEWENPQQQNNDTKHQQNNQQQQQQNQQKQQDFKQNLEPDEDEEEEFEEEQDNENIKATDLYIKIVNNKIADSFFALTELQRQTALDLILQHLLNNVENGSQFQAFDNEYSSRYDSHKIKVVNLYNEEIEEFSESEYDIEMPIVCDLVLDLLRYYPKAIIDAVNVISDYKKSIKQGQLYTLQKFQEKVYLSEYKDLFKLFFKVIALFREKKIIKSTLNASQLIAESILRNDQATLQSEIANIMKYLIDNQGKKQGANAMQSEVVAVNYAQDDRKNKKDQVISIQEQNDERENYVIDIQDEQRIEYAQRLKEKIEKKIQADSYSQPIYSAFTLSNPQNLMDIAEQIQQYRSIPNDKDVHELGGVLLFLMMSRLQRNIHEKDLVFLEDSADLNDFKGLFRDQFVKKLFDIMMKHFIFCIKKKVAKQKDIESLFVQAVINFECTDADYNIIKKQISDQISRALGYENYSGNNNQNSLNAGNDFFSQQFLMKKSKQGSLQNSEKMGGFQTFSPNSNIQLKEFQDPELDDYI